MTSIRKPRRMAREPQNPNINPAADGGRELNQIHDAQGKPTRATKQSMLIAMLSNEAGSSLSAIVNATGWQSHTARAALTGLRKKGHAIDRSSVDDETRYRIVEAAAEQ